MIVATTYSGVCDRLTLALLALRLARLSKKECVFIWPKTNVCNCEFTRLFSKPSEITVLPEGPFRHPEYGTFEELAARIPTLPGVVYLGGNAYYGHDYTGLDEVFQPALEVQSEVDRFYQTRWSERVIGVHIRRTDKKYLSAPPISAYVAAAKEYEENFGKCEVFLASDEVPVIKDFERLWGRRVMTYPVRSLDRNNPDSIVDAVTTLYLLRRSSVVVGSLATGFSICAASSTFFIEVPFKHCPNFNWSKKPIQLRSPELRQETGGWPPAEISAEVKSSKARVPVSIPLADGVPAAGKRSLRQTRKAAPVSIDHSIALPRRKNTGTSVLGLFDAAFLINMDKDVERLERCTRECEAAGLRFERFPAISAVAESSRVRSAEVGLSLSHCAIVELARERGYESVLILEDDVVFRPDFKLLWEKLVVDAGSREWDLFYFYDWSDGNGGRAPSIRSIAGTLCTHAYAVSQSFFDPFIEAVSREAESRAVDRVLADIPARKLATTPNLIGQEAGKSVVYDYWKHRRWSAKDG